MRTPMYEGFDEEFEKIRKKFCKRFKELRNDSCLTLDEVSDWLKVSRQSIVYYSMGDRIPTIPVLVKTAKLFGVSVDYLLGVSDKK